MHRRLSDPFLERPVGEAVGRRREAQVVFEVEVAARRWRGEAQGRGGGGGARSKTDTLKHGTTTPD